MTTTSGASVADASVARMASSDPSSTNGRRPVRCRTAAVTSWTIRARRSAECSFEARGFTRIKGSPRYGDQFGHRPGALVGTFWTSPLDYAPLTDPQVIEEPRTTRKRPFARLVRVIVPATSLSRSPRRSPPAQSLSPCVSAGVIARRAPSATLWQEGHHCEPYPWAHERSSRSPSRAPSSSASPRRPRPRRRPSPPKASRSSRSPSGRSAIRGATARPGRPPSIAPAS